MSAAYSEQHITVTSGRVINMQLGLTSLSMPELSVDAIIKLAKDNGLSAIEWSEKHIKQGDVKTALSVNRKSKASGLNIVAYHSDFDVQNALETSFAEVLQTAKALDTDTIILSAGVPNNDLKTEDRLQNLSAKVPHLADMALAQNMVLCFAYSQNTILEDYIHTAQFLSAVKRDNVRLSWQPSRISSLIYNIFDLKMLASFVQHVYISYMEASEGCTTMIESKDEWQQYLKVLKGHESSLLLFRDFDVTCFHAECQLMREWIADIYKTKD